VNKKRPRVWDPGPFPTAESDREAAVAGGELDARAVALGAGLLLLLLLLLLTGGPAPAAAASRTVAVHTYATSDGREIAQVIAVSTTTLLPLLPPGYQVVPASALGVGSPSQGIVAIANFQGFQPTIDQGADGNAEQVAIDVGILVAEPQDAALANVNLPGAFHFYTLAIYTDDSHYRWLVTSGRGG
jgi:hypothetical protein